MVELPNPIIARIQALLGAFGSWVFLLWAVGLPFFASRTYFFTGIGITAIIMVGVILISLLLKCPRCGKSIAIKTKSTFRLSPDWHGLREQFFPIEAVMGKSTSAVCPHCGIEVSIPMGAESAI
jgi:endogenous inhibitor of DNA gyrase (YacG/DUF329 family)